MTDFIISDIHVPYQDHAAVKIVTRMAHHFKPQNIIINGDALDNVQLSRFSHDPFEPESLKANIEELCSIIKDFQKYSNVIYIQGNHESRFQQYINDKAPDLHGLITMEGLINDGLDTKINYIRNVPKESMMEWNDDLIIGHFNKVSQQCCYTVKLLIDRFKTSVVQAHTHRLGEYRFRGQKGVLRGWESGCLCDTNPSYALLPNWQQGFLIYYRINNSWNIETVPIYDENAMFRGKMYKV